MKKHMPYKINNNLFSSKNLLTLRKTKNNDMKLCFWTSSTSRSIVLESIFWQKFIHSRFVHHHDRIRNKRNFMLFAKKKLSFKKCLRTSYNIDSALIKHE